jgi:hypothetical protein
MSSSITGKGKKIFRPIHRPRRDCKPLPRATSGEPSGIRSHRTAADATPFPRHLLRPPGIANEPVVLYIHHATSPALPSSLPRPHARSLSRYRATVSRVPASVTPGLPVALTRPPSLHTHTAELSVFGRQWRVPAAAGSSSGEPLWWRWSLWPAS